MKTKVDDQKRINVHRRGAVGDVLLGTTALREVRKKYPDHKIVMSTFYPEILEESPFIDEIVKSERPLKGDFDKKFDLDYELTPERHIVEGYSKSIGLEIENRFPALHLTTQEIASAHKLMHTFGLDMDKPICGMHMNSGWDVRDWPKEYFKNVAEELISQGVQVVLLGHKKMDDSMPGVDLRDETSLRELCGVIFKLTALLAIDSSLLHIAAALGTPTVSLFGCTDPQKRLPEELIETSFYSDEICHGCHHRQRPIPAIYAPKCPFETVKCMVGIQPEAVLKKLIPFMKLQTPTVSVVIPHYSKYEFVENCLKSLFFDNRDVDFEVIVVDDKSKDNSVRDLLTWAPRVKLIQQPKNGGFSSACNAGAKAAQGKYIAFLNNDTKVTSYWLRDLVAKLEEDDHVAMVGPKLLFEEGDKIQHCGTVINADLNGEHVYKMLPTHFVPANKYRHFRAITGAAFLLRRSDFIEAGGLDEEYKMGGEDTDLCFKFLEQGKYCGYCPTSVVYHGEGLSRGKRAVNHPDDVYNRKRLKEKWEKFITPDHSDYLLLGEIESGENQTWPILSDVPKELIKKYDNELNRSVGRFPLAVELGSGMHPDPGYVHIEIMEDAPSVDIHHDLEKPLPLLANSVGKLLANHVLEHVSWRRLPNLVKDIQRIMIPGGKVYIRTPNLRFISETYLADASTPESPDDESEMKRLYKKLTPGLWANIKLFSGQDYPSNFHYNCMDPEDLRQLFLSVGFSEVSLEHFGREYSPGEIQLIAEK